MERLVFILDKDFSIGRLLFIGRNKPVPEYVPLKEKMMIDGLRPLHWA